MDALLLHGFTHTGASWGRVLAGLPAGYRAATPDLRGHGSLSGTLPVTLAGVLDDLAALVEGCPPAGLTLCGYSQGARIALHAALDQRIGPKLRRIVLIGGSPGLRDASERAERRRGDERLASEFEALTIGELAERWARTPVLQGLPPDVAEEVRMDRLRSSPAGLAAALRGLGTGSLPSLWERLGEIAAPATLIVGAKDAKFVGIAHRMAASLPACEVRVIAGSGHAVHLEQPGTVVSALTGFPGATRAAG